MEYILKQLFETYAEIHLITCISFPVVCIGMLGLEAAV
jgi:hypothetical protein